MLVALIFEWMDGHPARYDDGCHGPMIDSEISWASEKDMEENKEASLERFPVAIAEK